MELSIAYCKRVDNFRLAEPGRTYPGQGSHFFKSIRNIMTGAKQAIVGEERIDTSETELGKSTDRVRLTRYNSDLGLGGRFISPRHQYSNHILDRIKQFAQQHFEGPNSADVQTFKNDAFLAWFSFSSQHACCISIARFV